MSYVLKIKDISIIYYKVDNKKWNNKTNVRDNNNKLADIKEALSILLTIGKSSGIT